MLFIVIISRFNSPTGWLAIIFTEGSADIGSREKYMTRRMRKCLKTQFGNYRNNIFSHFLARFLMGSVVEGSKYGWALNDPLKLKGAGTQRYL